MFVRKLSLILLFAAPGGADADSGPPQWLLGKSIILNYREVRSFEPTETGHGLAHDDMAEVQTLIYISDRGRIFAQAKSTVNAGRNGSRSSNRIKSPGSTSEGYDWRFEGETLYGFAKQGEERSGSVKRVTVRFSRDSQSCAMTLAYARVRGSGAAIVRGWYGEDYFLRRDELTSSTCELKAGNVFEGAR